MLTTTPPFQKISPPSHTPKFVTQLPNEFEAPQQAQALEPKDGFLKTVGGLALAGLAIVSATACTPQDSTAQEVVSEAPSAQEQDIELAKETKQTGVMVHPDGSTTTVLGNTVINSDGTSAVVTDNMIIESDGEVSTKVGNTTFRSDGSYETKVGNTTFKSDGSYEIEVGNTVINSDGTVGTRIGNTTFNSDGTTSTRMGNIEFGSDGTINFVFD